MGKIFLVTGGARSGKSSFAESLAGTYEQMGQKIGYIATAEKGDAEMTSRIEKHINSRPKSWVTFEDIYDFSAIISANLDFYIFDCLTNYLSRRMFEGGIDFEKCALDEIDTFQNMVISEFEEIIESFKSAGKSLVIVTNELGSGIVPIGRLSRVYRDIHGFMGQAAARLSDEVYLCTVGIATRIK